MRRRDRASTRVQRYVCGLLGRPLERDPPLWQLHLIDGNGGGSAVYTRTHHSVADGIALVRLLLSMTDDEPGATHFLPPVATAGATALGKELLLPADRRTVPKGRMGEHQHVRGPGRSRWRTSRPSATHTAPPWTTCSVPQ